MKNLKKILALATAGVLAFGAVPVFAGQDASGLKDGTAYLNINMAGWGAFEAEYTNAEITGDGSYTVSMTAAEAIGLEQFNALEVVNGESILGTASVITVDSIKINGEEVKLEGDSYTCSADGAAVTTRVNIYNAWNTPDPEALTGDDKHVDNRCAGGDVTKCTATLISSDYIGEDAKVKVKSMEVSFTVSGCGSVAEGAGAQISDESLSLAVGKSATLSVTGNSGKVKWSSSKKAVAKVNKKGVVKAVKAGKAVIKAKVDGKTLKCKVKVTK
ncbi:MAG: Ig-like domain-containing protein [Lachnospiraceae bacterium]|nr:Ig-like domain-containing protein [Lachnospiraceae bacterium]